MHLKTAPVLLLFLHDAITDGSVVQAARDSVEFARKHAKSCCGTEASFWRSSFGQRMARS